VSTDQLVLVIEDEPQIRRFLRATLTNHGYRLIEAINAQTAWRRRPPTTRR